MIKVQWLGGPTDGDWLELQEGMESLEIFTTVEQDPEKTRVVPVKWFKDANGNQKQVLDYYHRDKK